MRLTQTIKEQIMIQSTIVSGRRWIHGIVCNKIMVSDGKSEAYSIVKKSNMLCSRTCITPMDRTLTKKRRRFGVVPIQHNMRRDHPSREDRKHTSGSDWSVGIDFFFENSRPHPFETDLTRSPSWLFSCLSLLLSFLGISIPPNKLLFPGVVSALWKCARCSLMKTYYEHGIESQFWTLSLLTLEMKKRNCREALDIF